MSQNQGELSMVGGPLFPCLLTTMLHTWNVIWTWGRERWLWMFCIGTVHRHLNNHRRSYSSNSQWRVRVVPVQQCAHV